MNNVINRQDAIDVVRQYCIDHHIEDGIYHANGIEYELSNLPSAEPEIIRCEDCKHSDFSGLHGGRLYCMKHESYWYADDFCSKAKERREDT